MCLTNNIFKIFLIFRIIKLGILRKQIITVASSTKYTGLNMSADITINSFFSNIGLAVVAFAGIIEIRFETDFIDIAMFIGTEFCAVA